MMSPETPSPIDIHMMIQIWEGVLTVIISILGWTIQGLYREINSLRKELHETREYAGRKYITRSELQKLNDRMFEELRAINIKIDQHCTNMNKMYDVIYKKK